MSHTFDINTIRNQFPALQQAIVYLDSAATTQKPQCVIDKVQQFYSTPTANVHRGTHPLTANVTQAFEQARQQVQTFLNARSEKEIIWTRGATESLNLIAQSYARHHLQTGDEILIGEMEHHANIVPWQIIAQQTGANIIKVPMTSTCQWDMQAYQSLLSEKTKIVTAAHITNVTGTRQPIEEIIRLAHEQQAVVVIDGAQGIVHETVDVQALDCDFYVFSGHKLYAPNGIGVLYGKQDLLTAMPVWHCGGKMVHRVYFDHTEFADLPAKFEAGTPNIEGAIALATAIDWLNQQDREALHTYQHSLHQYLVTQLKQRPEVTIIGLQPNACVISFMVQLEGDVIHHDDVATLLNQQNIAIRSGHHCAHPFMDALGINGTLRISLGIYNSKDDIEAFLSALDKAIGLL